MALWAICVAFFSTFCWGTWSNSLGASKLPLALFYPAYAVAVLLVAVAAVAGEALVDGAWPSAPRWDAAALSFAAGVLLSVGNVLLLGGVKAAGLAVAFPVGVGSAMVLGTVVGYATDPSNAPVPLFAGLLCALTAVVCVGRAHELRLAGGEPLLQSDPDPDPVDAGATRRLLLAAGFFVGIWSPVLSVAANADESMSAITSFALLAAGIFAAAWPLAHWQMARPLAPGEPQTSWGELRLAQQAYPMAGGAMWAAGTCSNVLASHGVGFALAFALGQVAPMVATTWGVLYYREFDEAPAAARAQLRYMYVLYMGAIGLLCWSSV